MNLKNLYLSIFFPSLSVDLYALSHSLKGEPLLLVLLEETVGGLRAIRVSSALEARGVHVGSSLVLVRARCSGVHEGLFDEKFEFRWLKSVRKSLLKVSPIVMIDSVRSGDDWGSYGYSHLYDGIVVDCNGLERLYKSFGALIEKVLGILDATRVNYRLGFGPTVASSWALSRFIAEDRNCAFFKSFDQIYDLPLNALRVPREQIKLMHDFGLRKISDVISLDKSEIAERVCVSVVRELERINGVFIECLDRALDSDVYEVEEVYEDPISSKGVVTVEVQRLLCKLLSLLESSCCGARLFILKINFIDVRNGQCEIVKRFSLYSGRSIGEIKTIVFPMIEALSVAGSITRISIRADKVSILSNESRGLFGRIDDCEGSVEFRNFIVSNYGDNFAQKIVCRDSYLPEHASAKVALSSNSNVSGVVRDRGERAVDRGRPSVVLSRPFSVVVLMSSCGLMPLFLVIREREIKIVEFVFTERLDSEWWRAGVEFTRDYYAVLDEFGIWWWLYRQWNAGDSADRGAQTASNGNNSPISGFNTVEWFIHGLWV